ncbi:MAG TPA: HAMP domain-containing sensor histidine kinase [Ktedonobacterales bacterium]|jgi:signal transduction histidine kinase|nr:HAMP domain-containing sensor histidine kinase [Ktedonobacterales bacterium]
MTDKPRPRHRSFGVGEDAEAGDVEARRAFSWLASHALGNVLHSITSSLALLDMDVEGETLSDRQRTALRLARTDVTRLTRLTDDLLILTHAASGTTHVQPERLPLTTLLREAIAQAQSPLAPNPPRDVTSNVSRTLPPALVDPDLARRALAALIENALRFSVPETRVAVTARKRGDKAVIHVADMGTGVGLKDADHIFDPLYVGAGPLAHVGTGLGLGLGLAAARACAEAQGGHVWLESTSAAGSVFALELPLAPLSAQLSSG